MLFLLFQLGRDRYVLEASRVVEVLPMLELKKIPQAPKGVAGLFNYRGQPVPAVDLSQLTLDQPAAERLSTRIIVVKYADKTGRDFFLGLITEHATAMMRRERKDFVESGVTLDAAPYLGPVLMDANGVIQWVHEQRLLPEPVRDLLFAETQGADLMQPIENLLRRTMGLDAASIGPTLIKQTVRQRMAHHGLTKLEDYTNHLHATPAELNALVEAVVVKETWFFRDHEPFTALARLVQNEWLPAHPTGPLRLLSLPCATGEEPYSLAMTLLDARLPAARFRIDAVDISAHALEYARHAVYRKNSFRGRASGHGYLTRHFQPHEDGWLLNPTVREPVHFQNGNILADDCLAGAETYDIIFCRNLLIYFDRPTQAEALQKLARALKPGGWLFVGPVELPLVANHPDQLFVGATDLRGVGAARKAELSRAHLPTRPPAHLPRHAKVSGRKVPPAHLPTRPPAAAQGGKVGKGESGPADLAMAAQLADAGRLAEAGELCEKYLRAHGATAQAYYLLGLVRDAAGHEAQALAYYRKALYLAPDHYETLVQMATLTGKKGDRTGARRWHQRAQRILEKTAAKNG